MRSKGVIPSWSVCVLLLVLLALGGACGTDADEPQSNGEPPAPTTAPTGDVQATPTQPLPSETPALSPTATPPATDTPEPVSWYGADTLALVVVGDENQADLLALGQEGETRLIYEGVGRQVSVSPDGRWLGFVRWGEDGRAALELQDVRTGATRQITPDTTSGLLPFAFDSIGRRLAYLDLGAPGEGGAPWALVVVDLETDAVARYDALLPYPSTQPLPGSPVGWSNATAADELIIDTFVPYTEGGWMGVWGVTLPADGASAPLDNLDLRELVPGAPTYTSQVYLAPDGQSLAFLGRDADYLPDNYFPEFFDLAVNRLEIAALDDGARTTLVEVTDGSALGRVLAWSPLGDRLLFAQGAYEGESFATLTLKSTDRGGAVAAYGALNLPPLGGLLDLSWCADSSVLYVTWDGSDRTQRLFHFDPSSGVSTELSAAQRAEIVGCAP